MWRRELALCCAVPDAAPGDVGGGGGSRSELVITWEVIHPSNVGASFLSRLIPFIFTSVLALLPESKPPSPHALAHGSRTFQSNLVLKSVNAPADKHESFLRLFSIGGGGVLLFCQMNKNSLTALKREPAVKLNNKLDVGEPVRLKKTLKI